MNERPDIGGHAWNADLRKAAEANATMYGPLRMPGGVLPIRCVRVHPDAKLPSYATSGSVGLDLQTMVDINLLTGESMRVPTGLAIELPENYEAQIRPRSSTSGKGCLVNFGTCDSDYRGEMMINITVVGREAYIAKAGERIAQMVIKPVPRVELIEVGGVDELSKTDRSDKGFGSSGT